MSYLTIRGSKQLAMLTNRQLPIGTMQQRPEWADRGFIGQTKTAIRTERKNTAPRTVNRLRHIKGRI